MGGEIYTVTLKYFKLAIDRFMPYLLWLKNDTRDLKNIREIENHIEAYEEVKSKIESYNFDFSDPNKMFDGEPSDVENWMDETMLENLSRLSLRLLDSWKKELEQLKENKLRTDKDRIRIRELEGLIWPLETFSKEKSYLIGKHADKGILSFPGENRLTEDLNKNYEKSTETPVVGAEKLSSVIFSSELLSSIPPDVARLCDEFNFNYQNNKPNAAMLLLRRILPLTIVRKFQSLGKEDEIKNNDNEFFDTKTLLGKTEGLLSQKRIYTEIQGYKLLLDSSQHSYSLNVDMVDVEGCAVKIRLLLGDLFHKV